MSKIRNSLPVNRAGQSLDSGTDKAFRAFFKGRTSRSLSHPTGGSKTKLQPYASLYAKEADFINRTCASLADSVQYDEKTKEEYFAMPLTLDMTIDKLFDKLGRHLAHFTSAWLLTRPC